MYLKLNLFLFTFLFNSLFSHEIKNNILDERLNYSINNNDFYKGINNLKFKSSSEIIQAISEFIEHNTNTLEAKMGGEFWNCLLSFINNNKTGDFLNYLGLIGFSGKGVSDLGLEEECLKYHYIYYLLTYVFKNSSYVTFSDQTNAFLFFQQNTFYTGICLTRECNKILNFIFNETLDDKFYSYLKNKLNIQTAKIYDIGRVDNSSSTLNPYATYDEDGRYNPAKTRHEEKKYHGYNILQKIVIIILSIQFIISLFVHVFYKPYVKAKELKNEISDESFDQGENEYEEDNNQIFNIDKESKDTKEKSNFGGIAEFIYNYLSMFNNIKILLKKKNQYYNSNNLEIINFLRILCMILITFINNFEVLIKIPSKDFFFENFYKKWTFSILKFTSFGVDMWICLDGFESMYKLINYYKKYVFKKNKATMSFINLMKFYFYSFYKLISFSIFFLMVNYYNKYYIYQKSDRTLFEYYSNHIYNDKLDSKDLFLFLIPGYSFYYSYYLNISIYEETIISKFSLLIINEFQIYAIFLLIFYISNLLKSKIFDYFILIVNIIVYSLNYWICQFKKNEYTYYSYKLVLDNYLTTRYPHIIFNYFFLGAMAGLTCFYFKDTFSNNSLSNDNEKSPFRYCHNFIKFFDYLIQNGRFFWFFLILSLQILICFSFNIIVKFNDNSIYIPFNIGQKIVLCYETGIFILLFCFLIICMFFIKYENENKSKNHSSLFILIERTNFSFFNCINLIVYSYYCFFNFQLKLNLQNLWIVTFGIFFLVCFENLIFTLAFVFLFKIANKKIIKYYLSPKEKKVERIPKDEELFDKSRDSKDIK